MEMDGKKEDAKSKKTIFKLKTFFYESYKKHIINIVSILIFWFLGARGGGDKVCVGFFCECPGGRICRNCEIAPFPRY